MFSIYSQGWAADARKQSSIEVTKIKAFKKNNRVFLFVCFLGGFFILFLFSCSTAKQCLQNGVNGETALRWVFSTSVSPSAEGTRTHAKTNPGRVSLKAPSRRGHLWAIEMFSDQATVHKTNPIELPHDPRGHGRVSEIWQQIYLWGNFFWITSKRGSEMSLFWPNLIVNREIGSTTQRKNQLPGNAATVIIQCSEWSEQLKGLVSGQDPDWIWLAAKYI